MNEKLPTSMRLLIGTWMAFGVIEVLLIVLLFVHCAKAGTDFVVVSEQVTFCATEEWPYGTPASIPPAALGVYHFNITFAAKPDTTQNNSYMANMFVYEIWNNPARTGEPLISFSLADWIEVSGTFTYCPQGFVWGWRAFCLQRNGTEMSFSVPAWAMTGHLPGYAGPIYYLIRTYSYASNLWQPYYNGWVVLGASTDVCSVPVAQSTWGMIKQRYE